MPAASAQRNTRSARIAVVGGGVIGLSCALELARRGVEVRVFNQTVEGMGPTSARAAGMLGVTFEAAEGSPSLFALARRSAELWPAFAARLAQDGAEIGYSRAPAIVCALEAADAAKLKQLVAAARAQGLAAEILPLADALRIEPALSPRAELAALLSDDAQVDAEALWRGLMKAGRGMLARSAVSEIVCRDGFTIGGEAFDRVLAATGAAASAIRFVDASRRPLDPRLPQIQPVKGQMLALKSSPDGPAHVIRSLGEIYIAPKARWTLIGATSEPGRADADVSRQTADRLRAKAAALAPVLADAKEAASWAGVRPATMDGLPAIGETAIPGLFAALGHFRNGILLAPATADIVADMMVNDDRPGLALPFALGRFDKPAEAPHSR